MIDKMIDNMKDKFPDIGNILCKNNKSKLRMLLVDLLFLLEKEV